MTRPDRIPMSGGLRDLDERRLRLGFTPAEARAFIRDIEAAARADALREASLVIDIPRLRQAWLNHRAAYFRGPGTLIWHTCWDGCSEDLASEYADPRSAGEPDAAR
jgi:hypothetical protein